MNELISVILPVYNVEKYIRQALDSVINQTFKNLEIILVDDGSPDDCGKICDEYALKDNRIKVIHKENGGVSSARNAGIDASTGDWLYFMDPDDWIELNTLELSLLKAQETNSDVVFFNLFNIGINGTKKQKSIAAEGNKQYFSDMENINTLITYVGGYIWCSIFKSCCIKNKVRFDENIKIGEDFIFRLECYSYISSFAYIPKALYYYRNSNEGAMGKATCNFKKYADLMYEKLHSLSKSHKYPEYVQIIANSNCILNLNRVIIGAFNNSLYDNKKRKKVIFEYINSSNYQNSLKNYDAHFISGMAKIIVRFKKPTMFKIRCVYILKNIKSVLDRIKYLFSNLI